MNSSKKIFSILNLKKMTRQEMLHEIKQVFVWRWQIYKMHSMWRDFLSQLQICLLCHVFNKRMGVIRQHTDWLISLFRERSFLFPIDHWSKSITQLQFLQAPTIYKSEFDFQSHQTKSKWFGWNTECSPESSHNFLHFTSSNLIHFSSQVTILPQNTFFLSRKRKLMFKQFPVEFFKGL